MERKETKSLREYMIIRYKKELEKAILEENYERAAELKKYIDNLELITKKD